MIGIRILKKFVTTSAIRPLGGSVGALFVALVAWEVLFADAKMAARRAATSGDLSIFGDVKILTTYSHYTDTIPSPYKYYTEASYHYHTHSILKKIGSVRDVRARCSIGRSALYGPESKRDGTGPGVDRSSQGRRALLG
jgi:hypothetical protein